MIKDLEPTVPQEYILKGVVNAAMGQETGSVGVETEPLEDAPVVQTRSRFCVVIDAVKGSGLVCPSINS